MIPPRPPVSLAPLSPDAPVVLALESSCDETAAAVVADGRVLSSVVATQAAIHAPFGGIVPELASRQHLRDVLAVVERALIGALAPLDALGIGPKADRSARMGDRNDGSEAIAGLDRMDAIAVTDRPGLVGALLVGVQVARGLALARRLPIVGIHHMEGHVFSPFLGDEARAAAPFQPHVALLVSGGHTELVHVRGLGRYDRLGGTRDDAAGEAFDKIAQLLGLGYPGGPVIERWATTGRADAFSFPRAMAQTEDLEMSFSGLKTAVVTHVDRHGQPASPEALSDLCASVQAAIVDVLVHKATKATHACGEHTLSVVGGVSANAVLRARLRARCEPAGIAILAPELRHCGDNAAMIGGAACARIRANAVRSVSVRASAPLDDEHAHGSAVAEVAP